MGEFERLTEELKASKLPLIVYGAGSMSEFADMYLKKYNIDFDGYAVDAPYIRVVRSIMASRCLCWKTISNAESATFFPRYGSCPMNG